MIAGRSNDCWTVKRSLDGTALWAPRRYSAKIIVFVFEKIRCFLTKKLVFK